MVWSARRCGRLSLAVTVVVATATWLPPSSLAGPIAAGCAAAATGSHVAFVVDFGGATDSAGNVVQACVEVPSGDNDAEALAALSNQEGWPAPRYDQSGLLCAIDGDPAAGCGTPAAGGYDYWSYWEGTAGGWVYASTGPAFTTASATSTQGWRFQDPGGGNPSDPSPRGPADPAATCGSSTVPAAPSTVPPPTTPPPSTPPGPPASSSTVPAPGVVTTAASTAARSGAGGGGPTTPSPGNQSGKQPRPSTVTANVASPGAPARRKESGAARATPDAPTTTAPPAERLSNVDGPRALAGAASPRRAGGNARPALLTAIVLAAMAAGVIAYQRRHRGDEVG